MSKLDWDNIALVRVHAQAAERRIQELEAEVERLKAERDANEAERLELIHQVESLTQRVEALRG